MFSIQESLGFKLAKLLQNIDDAFEKELSNYGITSKHFGTMLIVKENESITQIEAANIQRVDRTTAGKLVDLLEEKELLIRVRHPKDRRAYCLELTQSGNALIHTLWDYMKKCEDESLSILKDKEKSVFLDMINVLSKEESI